MKAWEWRRVRKLGARPSKSTRWVLQLKEREWPSPPPSLLLFLGAQQLYVIFSRWWGDRPSLLSLLILCYFLLETPHRHACIFCFTICPSILHPSQMTHMKLAITSVLCQTSKDSVSVPWELTGGCCSRRVWWNKGLCVLLFQLVNTSSASHIPQDFFPPGS